MSLIQGFTIFLKISESSQNSRSQEVDIKKFIGMTHKHKVRTIATRVQDLCTHSIIYCVSTDNFVAAGKWCHLLLPVNLAVFVC